MRVEFTRDRAIANRWRRDLSMTRLRAQIGEHGNCSLAECYTGKVKYDPETFRADSQDLTMLPGERRFWL
jgi:hypothetical protein